MQIASAALLLTLFSLPAAAQAPANPAPLANAPAQAPAQNSPSAPAGAPAAAAAPAAPSGPPAPSTLLQPALDSVQQTVGGLKLDKWKGGSVRAEATASIASIQKDIGSTLPDILKQADAAPSTVTRMLPVLRNIDALYDVLAHVYDAARVAAPAEQVDQLQQAAVGLDKARHSFVDRLESSAAAQEKQVVVLQASLKAQPAPVCPVAPPPVETKPAATTAHKTVRKKPKPPAAKPATPGTAPATTQPAAKPPANPPS